MFINELLKIGFSRAGKFNKGRIKIIAVKTKAKVTFFFSLSSLSIFFFLYFQYLMKHHNLVLLFDLLSLPLISLKD